MLLSNIRDEDTRDVRGRPYGFQMIRRRDNTYKYEFSYYSSYNRNEVYENTFFRYYAPDQCFPHKI